MLRDWILEVDFTDVVKNINQVRVIGGACFARVMINIKLRH